MRVVPRLAKVGIACLVLAAGLLLWFAFLPDLLVPWSFFDHIWGPNRLITRAQKCLGRGDFDQALAFADRAVLCSPRLWITHYERAKVLEARGEFDESIKAYLAVDSLDLKRNYTLPDRGRVLEKMGESKKAARCYCEAILNNPKTSSAVSRVALQRALGPGHHATNADAVSSLLKFLESVQEQEPDNSVLAECCEAVRRKKELH